MIYNVRARFIETSAAEFRRQLLDGTIAGQKPDGAEIVASMNRAVINASGEVEWSETCYCQPPLAHERQTVLDHHFADISTEEIEEHRKVEGRSFIDYLGELADGKA